MSEAGKTKTSANAEPPLVYDLGMNNGDDSAYYLAKGFRVVGIDAHPELCRACEGRFEPEIASGQMTVLNCGVSDEAGEAEFSINVDKHAISTFAPEHFYDKAWAPQQWRRVRVAIIPLSRLIDTWGAPYFVKIDVEHYDQLVLADLMRNGHRPPFISTEAHHIDAFNHLVAMGYRRFRLVPGATVQARFGQARIRRLDGSKIDHAFPFDSSGPFGDDLPDRWMDRETCFSALMDHGLGWIDIHAAQ